MSIKEYINSLQELSEDIDTIIPTSAEKNKNSEVSTPLFLRQEMLKTIPISVWKSNSKVLEPCCGKGGFLIEILLLFLKWYPINNIENRYKYIVENLIFFTDINEKNINKCKKLLDPYNKYRLNYKIIDTLKINFKDSWSNFTCIIGNPPYLVQGNKTIYIDFIYKLINECRYLLFVIPSRWFVLSNHETFRNFFIDQGIKLIVHINDASEWFPIDLKGGACYFLKDTNHKGSCNFNGKLYDLNKYDIIIDPKHFKIVNYIMIMKNKGIPFLDSIYMSAMAYGINTNDHLLKTYGSFRCFVSELKNEKRIMFLDSVPKNCYTGWKVITMRSTGSGSSDSVSSFGHMRIAGPDEYYSGSYIGFFVHSRKEAESLLSYLQCKLPNYLLGLRKNTQDISENTLTWIPLVPLDTLWDDTKVSRYFTR